MKTKEILHKFGKVGLKFRVKGNNSEMSIPEAAKLASTLTLSALEATATFRPAFLHWKIVWGLRGIRMRIRESW